ncbi:MAG: FG-GAP-like repeat-containing protein [Cyclobacteriaceae bacterium]
MKLKTILLSFLLIISISSFSQNWTGLNGPFGGAVSDFVTHSSGAIIVATSTNGVWRSTDNGANWSKMSLGTDFSFADLDNDPSGNLYAATGIKLYKSADGGITWINLNSTGISANVRKIEVVSSTVIYLATSLNQILKSSNGGTSFSLTSSDITTQINDLKVKTGGANDIVYAATSGQGMRVSTDGGFVFNGPSSGISATEVVYSVVLNSAGTLFALAASSPYSSTNGTTWTSIKGTIPDVSFLGTLSLDASQNLYLTNTISRKIYTGGTAGAPWNSGVAYPTHISPTNVEIQSASSWLMGSSSTGMFKSTDLGVNWNGINNGMKAAGLSSIFITAQNRLFQTIPSGSGYYQSIDDGANWTLQSVSPADRNIQGFIKLADNSVLAYGFGGVIKSTGTIGNTWTSINTTNFLPQVVTYDGLNIFSFSSSNLLISNGTVSPGGIGQTWSTTAISGLSGSIAKIQVDASNTIYIRTTNSFLYKLPFGSSTATQILTGVGQDFSIAAEASSATLYALLSSTSVSVSADGGTTWLTKTFNSSFSGSKIWAFRNGVIITAALTGVANISKDAGSTWASAPLADNAARVADVILNTSEIAYLATSNSVVHKSDVTIIPPLAPTGLSLNITGQLPPNGFRAELLWNDNSNNETNYVLEQSVGTNLSYQTVQTLVAVNSFQKKGRAILSLPIAAATYFFRVSAINVAGQSITSNEISFSTPNTPCTNTIPGNRSWTATTVVESGFTANGSGPFNSLAVLIDDFGGNIFFANEHSFNITPPAPAPARPNFEGLQFLEDCGKTAIISGTSVNSDFGNGNGTWNSTTNTLILKWQGGTAYQPFKATTTYTLNNSDPIPTTPQLSLYIYSSNEVFVNWATVGFETQYKIYRSPTSGGTFTPIATVNFPLISYIDKGLTAGATYFYKISALNAAGESPLSAETAITLGSSLFRPVENDIQLNVESQQGVSWGDLDGDGDEDLAVPSFQNSNLQNLPPVFYENIGGGQFTRKTLGALADENTAISRGIALFDFDNDNDLDMFIARSGPLACLLLINNGNWAFTKTAVVESIFATGTGSTFRALAVLDYDKDGKADIFVGNDFGSSPFTYSNYILKNVNGTSVSKITSDPFVTDLNGTLTIAPGDYDNDGDQDLFLANRGTNVANKLYKNNGDGTFALATGLVFDTDLMTNGRTASWGDIDNDGDLDLYVGQSTQADKLYQNNGDGTFTSLTSSPVAETNSSTTGSAFGDIDNDGDIDLIVVNGGANSIFINNGTGTYTKSSTLELLVNPNIAEIGGSFCDFDKDGFLDFYPSLSTGSGVNLPNLLYKNTLTTSSTRNWVEIKLIGKQSNASALGARIKVVTTTPARTQIREVASLTGFGSQNSLIQHFGLGSAASISQIEIKWPSGAVQTLNNFGTINTIITITEDVTAPLITVVAPANGSTIIPLGNKISFTVTDISTFNAVAGKKITLIKTATPATPVQVLDVTAGTLSGTTYTFTLAASLEYLTQYSISIDAGAFVDLYQNASIALPTTAWTFTTIEQPDATAPVISTFTPPSTLPKGFTSQTFTVTATDNKAVTSVIMSYRKVSASTINTLAGVAGASNTYTFALQNSFVDDMGIEYYFEATDAAGNKTRSPAAPTPPATQTFYLTRTAFNNTNMGIAVTAGATVNDYQIVSIPFDLPAKQVQFVFQGLGDPDKTKWRLLRYQNSPAAWVDYPGSNFTDVVQGEGYFVASREGANLKFGDKTTDINNVIIAPNNTQSNLFKLNLKKGWNLIGNPYSLTIIWNDSRLTGVGALKFYQGGAYVDAPNNGQLERLKGGFVLADNDVQVPVKINVTAQGGRQGSLPSGDLSAQSWIVPLHIQQSDLTYTLGGIGMDPQARAGKDDWDDVNPPKLNDEYVEMHFAHPEYFLKSFSRDVVPTANEQQWNFTVASGSASPTTMHWDNSLFGSNGKELFLLDLKRQILIDMSRADKYTFNPLESNSFRVYFGSNLKDSIKPTEISIASPYPNPSTKDVQVGFTLPDGAVEYQVNFEVYDLQGRLISTIAKGPHAPGFYEAIWSAPEESAATQIYLFKLSVVSTTRSEVATKKIIINR